MLFQQTSSISRRLYSGVLLALFFLFLEFAGIYFFSSKLVKGLQEAYDTDQKIKTLGTIEEQIQYLGSTAEKYFLPHAELQELRKVTEERRLVIHELIADIHNSFLNDPLLFSKLDLLLAARSKTAEHTDKILKAMSQGQIEEAKASFTVSEQFRQESYEALDDIRLELRSRLDESYQSLNKLKKQPILVGLCLLILLGSTMSFLGFHLARDLKTSLINLETATEKVRLGDLETKAEILLNDEIGKLTHAFNQMINELKNTTVSLDLLEEKNKELQQFSYMASHDLQEPLRTIIAYGDVLLEDYGAILGKEGKRNIETMQSASRRLRALVEALLQYSRITRRQEAPQKVNLNEIISEILFDLEASLHESSGRVEYNSLPSIQGDPIQIRQLFQNLIGNALKFRKPQTSPFVSITALPKSNEYITIQVQDNGIGLDEKFKDKIFQPFQRLHSWSEYQGTGIGLAICKRIVEKHGGTIDVKSSPGVGALFTFDLPLAKD